MIFISILFVVAAFAIRSAWPEDWAAVFLCVLNSIAWDVFVVFGGG